MVESSGPSLRPDIQALRMIAVGSVLLFHLWPEHLPGGFVGVDVFFAISGFLITSHLVREASGTGRLRLGRFWARRAKRLLPASLLVLLVTTIGVLSVVTVGERSGFLHDVVGATFYVENWVLAHDAVQYSASDDASSPVQHFWTLSVEEQFYVAVPILIALTTLVARRAGAARPVRWVVAVLGVVALVSLAYSVHLTSAEPGVAYFSTGTRAWEFVVGGLLGCWAARSDARPLPRPVALALAWGGLAAILLAVLWYDADTAFPGYAAALPVLGTVAAIAAAGSGPVELLGRLRPVRFVGDVSYATYLWHWPLIVLVPYATGHRLTDAEKVAIGVVTLLLAWASTRFVEDPVRFSPRLLGAGRRPRTVGLVCAAAMLVVAGTATWGGRSADDQVAAARTASQTLIDGTDVACLGAGAVHGRPASCPDLGDTVLPAPETAGLDDHNDVDCWAGDGSEPQVCRLEPPGRPTLRVLAVGDSHNNVYLPLYESLATDQGWQVDVTGRGGCTWGTRPQNSASEATRDSCTAWKENIADLLAAEAPYDVILTTGQQTGGLALPEAGETPQEATVDGLRQAWQSQIDRGSVVVAIRDNPLARDDVVACVELHGIDGAEDCAVSRDFALSGYDSIAAAVEETPGSAMVSVRDLMCGEETCSPVIGNVAVYRDRTHMTATFVRTLVPIITPRILRAIDEAESSRSAAS